MKKLLVCIIFLISACASTPVIPEGMFLVNEKKLDQLIQEYHNQQEQLKELRSLQEWRDSMFF
jgi:hypothetical protein